MARFMAENRPPGAAVAVARNGRLVYARGFGYANLETREPVQPGSLFRIASVSKPIMERRECPKAMMMATKAMCGKMVPLNQPRLLSLNCRL